MEILADREKGFAYLARKVKARSGRKVQRLKIEGIGVLDDARRYYPGEKAAQVIGSVGVDNVGPVRDRAAARRGAARRRRRAADREGRARRPGVARRAEGRSLRQGPAPDDRRSRSGPRRAGAGRGGADLPAQGRHRDRDGPAQRRPARDGELAARGRQRGRGGARLGAPEPRGRLHLRAGLDLQVDHRSRAPRVRGGSCARDTRSGSAPDPGRRPDHQGGARHRRDLHRVRHPGALVERGRRADRPAARRGASTAGCTASASAASPICRCRASRRDRAARQGLLGLLDREPADRPGPGRHAGADGRAPTPRSRTAACS